MSSADLSTLAHGGNPKRGFMVDYLGNFGESARAGLPVYRLGGGRGFVWIASLGSGARQSALRFFAADPSQMPHVTGGEPQQGGNDTPSPRVEPPRSAEPPRQDEHAGLTTGTGFFVSAAGHIVTNAHVVEGCSKPLVVAGLAAPSLARVAARDAKNDLALIVSDVKPTSVAKLRIGVKTGESIAAFGYPLTGVLSTSGNFTAGNVSAVAGLEDDTRFIQISAPVQPGNSGGPLLDQSANVVGVVTGKLNALKFAEATQDVPQNVNFAIKTTLLINFLEANGVSYVMGDAGPALAYADLAERGRSMSALIECGEPGLMR
ncbi:MAG TPA: serine protease [Methylocystis sp.]|nr:serine protease [Methylocystis sp.]